MDWSRFKVKVILPSEGPFSKKLRKINVNVKILHLPLNLLRFKRKIELKSFLSLIYFFTLPFFLLQLGVYLKKNRFHLILTNTIKAHFYGSLAAWFCSIPVIWRFHDLLSSADFSPWVIKSVIFFGKRFPRKILAVSSLTKDLLIKHGLKQDKIEVIYSSIDYELFEIKNDYHNIKDELKLENQVKLVGCIGRIIPQKGQKSLLQAIPGVIEKYPETFFLIIGDFFLKEEVYRHELLELIKRNGIEKSVRLIGFRTDIGDVIRSLDMVIFPSTAPESFGLSILEAMALGKPVIATRVGGVSEMIEDRVNGILIEPDHPEQITEQMIQLLSQKEMCDRIGKRAKETVMKKFPLKNYIDEMEKAFDSMVLKEVFF